MKLGIMIPWNGPRVKIPVETIQLAESLGYDSLWLSDAATLATPAPLVALAAVAARSQRLKLGTGVLIAPPRNPVLLAKELATPLVKLFEERAAMASPSGS